MRASRGRLAGAGRSGLARDHQVRRAMLNAHDPGFALARSKPRFPFQLEFARTRQEASGPLCGEESIHRRRRHHTSIFETESTVAYARPVAKACILSRQILAVCNSYNERASASDLPALELGLGVAFQGSAPTYWTDGDSRIMISKALNLSDRLSGCAKLAKRMLGGQKTHFSVFQFLNTMEGASAEELDEFLVRYNHNGIELNDEGFQKLSEEISLESIETKLDMPWGKQNVSLYYGEVPLGESVELLVLRKAFARQLLPDGKIGGPTSHPYYEVSTSPALYAPVARLPRPQQAAAIASQRSCPRLAPGSQDSKLLSVHRNRKRFEFFHESLVTRPGPLVTTPTLYCSRRRKESGDFPGLQS